MRLFSTAPERGFTLAEVVVAILVMAVVTLGIFAVVSSNRTATQKVDKKVRALFYSRQAMDKLKAYVTADSGAGGPTPNWRIPEDSCNAGLGTCTPTCWALEACTHDLTAMLPAACGPGVPFCSGSPINAKLSYTVTDLAADPGCGAGQAGPVPCKRVVFNMQWSE